MRHASLITLLLVTACADPAARAALPVVYGADDRVEVYAHPDATLRAIAESAIGMQLHEGWIDDTDPDDVRITYTDTLGEAEELCAGERFADQIEPGTCSGTLVDAQHILTAGHCMETAEDCDEYVWVLGFRYASDGVLAPLTSDDVYRCDQVAARFDDGFVDFAFVRLDRPVVGHEPAETRRHFGSGATPGTPVAMIGHPNGIPMKIDSGAVITSSDSSGGWGTATLDAFAGSSGSGVFEEGALIGLLRGGETDYVNAGGCNVVNVIDPPPTDDGETVSYLEPARAAFCATGVASPVCDTAPLEGDRCDDATPIEPIGQTIEGSTIGYAGDEEGSCGGAGPDRAYTFTLTAPARIVAYASGFDTVLYLRAGCAGEELACNDDVDVDTDRGSRIEAELAPGEHVLLVDAYEGGGDYTLELDFEPLGGADASTPAPDASTPGPDAGGPTPRPRDMGCGCGIAARAEAHGAIALALLALTLRRRRQGGTTRPA